MNARVSYSFQRFSYGVRYVACPARSRGNPKVSLWLSVDPLAGEYPGISPFAYTYGNPVRFVDPTGMEGEAWDHDYKLNKKTGEIELIRETDDNFDRLYATNEDGNIIKGKYLKIRKKSASDKTIIASLSNDYSFNILFDSGSTEEDITLSIKTNIAITSNKESAFKLFKFVTDNSYVEWSINKFQVNNYIGYQIGTYHLGPYNMQGLYSDAFSPSLFYIHPSFKILGTMHSHPLEQNPYESMWGDLQIGHQFHKKYGIDKPYYIYFPHYKNGVMREIRTYFKNGRYHSYRSKRDRPFTTF